VGEKSFQRGKKSFRRGREENMVFRPIYNL
jgi:hypothetical protein